MRWKLLTLQQQYEAVRVAYEEGWTFATLAERYSTDIPELLEYFKAHELPPLKFGKVNYNPNRGKF